MRNRVIDNLKRLILYELTCNLVKMKVFLIINILFIVLASCKNKKVIYDREVAYDMYEDMAYEISRKYVYDHLEQFDSLLQIIDSIYTDSLYIFSRNGDPEYHMTWEFKLCNDTSGLLSTCEPQIIDLMTKLKIKEVQYVGVSGRKSMEIPIVIPDTIGSDDYRFSILNLFRPPKNTDDSLGFWFLRMYDLSMF